MAKIIFKEVEKIVIVLKAVVTSVVGGHGDCSIKLFGGHKRCCNGH